MVALQSQAGQLGSLPILLSFPTITLGGGSLKRIWGEMGTRICLSGKRGKNDFLAPLLNADGEREVRNTSACPPRRLTEAECTPLTPRSASSTADEQDEHVMPPTRSTTLSRAAAAPWLSSFASNPASVTASSSASCSISLPLA